MLRYTPSTLGLAALMLAGCGDSDGPPVVQVSGAGAAAQTLQAQITNLQTQFNNLQNQVSTLQQRIGAVEGRLPQPR